VRYVGNTFSPIARKRISRLFSGRVAAPALPDPRSASDGVTSGRSMRT